MSDPIIRRTFAVIVDNEPGVLARVVGLFSGRGYNIESLTVTEVEADRHRSRITIVTNGTYQIWSKLRLASPSGPGSQSSGSNDGHHDGRARAGHGEGCWNGRGALKRFAWPKHSAQKLSMPAWNISSLKSKMQKRPLIALSI